MKKVPRDNSVTAYFKPDEKEPEDDSVGALMEWYKNLPAEVKQSIEAGNRKIELTARADARADADHNLNLASQRTAAVVEVLKLIAPHLDENHITVEKARTKATGKEREHRKDRSVRIQVAAKAREGG